MVESVEISTVNGSDIAGIIAIEKRANITPWSQQMLFDALESNHDFLLCRGLDGQIKAYLIGQSVADEASLLHIAVEPNFQSQGLGRQLLNFWLQSLCLDVKAVWLEVRETNIKAQTLYQAEGFKRVGERKAYYRLPNSTQKETALIYCLKRL